MFILRKSDYFIKDGWAGRWRGPQPARPPLASYFRAAAVTF